MQTTTVIISQSLVTSLTQLFCSLLQILASTIFTRLTQFKLSCVSENTGVDWEARM